MRLVKVEAATFRIGKKRFDSETLLIIKERLFRSLHITDQIQWLGFSFAPTTQHHHRTIRILGEVDLLELNEPPRLETPSQFFQGKRLALPRRRRTRRRAARIEPAQTGPRRGLHGCDRSTPIEDRKSVV